MSEDVKLAASIGEAIEAHRKFALDTIERAAAQAEDRIKRGRYTESEADVLRTFIGNARTALKALDQHLDGMIGVSPESDTMEAWFYVGELMNAMYLIGSMMEPSPAVERAAVSFHQRARSQKAATARAQRGMNGWTTQGLDHAKNYVRDRPIYKQMDVAAYIKERMPTLAPEAIQIREYVSRWQADGSLPRSK
jgi:hypothetical protein